MYCIVFPIDSMLMRFECIAFKKCKESGALISNSKNGDGSKKESEMSQISIRY